MSTLQDVVRLKSVLKKYTLESREDNIHFGNYPHIALTGKKLSVMPYQDTLRNWFLPMGVPFTVMSDDRMGVKRKYVAYGIGDELFVHRQLYDRFLGRMNQNILSIPVAETTTSLKRSGWLEEETELYEKLLWRIAIRTSGGDFQRISRVDFDTKLNLDKDVLARDGWAVNGVLGSNAFYGLVSVKTRKQDDNRIFWYNKYIVLADLTSGTGLMIDGLTKYDRNPHPHVHPDLRLCFGGYERQMYGHINKGEVTAFFMLVKHFLQQFNPQSPTFGLPVPRGRRDGIHGIAHKFFTKNIVMG